MCLLIHEHTFLAFAKYKQTDNQKEEKKDSFMFCQSDGK